jgi:uncharacterized membrane protein YfcA
MLTVSGLMGVRQLRGRRTGPVAREREPQPTIHAGGQRGSPLTSRSTDRIHSQPSPARTRRPTLDDPIISFSPSFACQCPQALKVLVAATGVGLLTGFLGVGGGFLVVPALVLALALPLEYATGTSLVVIAVTSAFALAVRAGARVAMRTDTARLSVAFTVLVLCVAAYTADRALPALV